MKIRTIIQQFVMCTAAAALLGVAPAATADSLVTQGYVAPPPQKFDLSFGGSPNTGGFKGTWNGEDIVFWCIELDQFFALGTTYTDYVASSPDNATMTLLGKLFTQAYSVATSDPTHSAAFQLAIWEIIYNPADLNIYGGSFYVKPTPGANPYYGNPATVALAQTWLSNLGNYNDNYDLMLLLSSTHQNFVTVPPGFRFQAPEPSALLLMLVALAAMYGILRRRTRSTA